MCVISFVLRYLLLASKSTLTQDTDFGSEGFIVEGDQVFLESEEIWVNKSNWLKQTEWQK